MTGLFVRSVMSSAEVADASRQAEKRFADAIYEAGLGGALIPDFDQIQVHLCLSHPCFGFQTSKRPHVSKADRTIWVQEGVRYSKFCGGWDERINAIAAAVHIAVEKLPRSRVGEAARAHFSALIEAAAAIARRHPPAILSEIRPVYVKLNADGYVELVSTSPTQGYVLVHPHESDQYRRAPVQEAHQPLAFTLYRKTKGETPHYVSAWFHEGRLHIHRGVCGTRGTLTAREVATEAEARPLLSDVRREAVAEGYKAIGFSGMTHMAASYPAETETGPPMSTQDRHQLEDQWTNLLGWYGLGDCDSRDSGMGAHDVHFYVVNAKLAMATINSEPEFQALKGAAHVFVVKD